MKYPNVGTIYPLLGGLFLVFLQVDFSTGHATFRFYNSLEEAEAFVLDAIASSRGGAE